RRMRRGSAPGASRSARASARIRSSLAYFTWSRAASAGVSRISRAIAMAWGVAAPAIEAVSASSITMASGPPPRPAATARPRGPRHLVRPGGAPILLRREIVEEAALGPVGRSRDVVHRRGVGAALQEQRQPRLGDALPGLTALALAQALGLRPCRPPAFF